MTIRVNKASRDLNISIKTAIEYLASINMLMPGIKPNPNIKLTDEQYDILKQRFNADREIKKHADILKLKLKKKDRKSDGPSKNDSVEISTTPLSNTISEENKTPSTKRLVTVLLSSLRYENRYIILRQKKQSYVCFNIGISESFDSYKNYPPIKDMTAEIILDSSNHTLRFKDQQVLERFKIIFNEIGVKINQEKEIEKEKAKEKKAKEERKNKKAEHQSKKEPITTIRFSKIKFGEGFARIKRKNHFYKYRNAKIKGFSRILISYYNTITQRERRQFDAKTIKISINEEKHSFFFIDFNLCDFIMNIKNSYLIPSELSQTEKAKQQLITKKRTTRLGIDNIEFFDGYYMVIVIDKGKKNYSITPLKVIDNNSFSFLRHVHRYLSERLPKDIIIEYTDERVLRINRPYILSNYIRTLNENIDVHGEWWEEVQNERKPSLSYCRNTSIKEVKKKVSFKNGYLDTLASMQNDKKLIPVYEINHGTQEDAFIFTVGMPNDRCAIIFENVSSDASTATEVFITKNNNYESCVNLVFDYFTDYTISTKRDSLRKGINPPIKFKAEKFYNVVHGELESWLIKMNQIIERTSQSSKIDFSPGLHVPKDTKLRSGYKETNPQNIHNELMRKLYSQLCVEHGDNCVGTEIRIGSRRIDAVVKNTDCYDIYEIKSDPDPFVCITIALGQICQYAYLYCRDRIGKMVIVGSTRASKEVEEYLAWFREKHSMKVYYRNI